YETNGFVLRATDRATGEVLGTALVAVPHVYSSHMIPGMFQRFHVEVILLLKWFLWTVGLPPPLTKLRTYGAQHLKRFIWVKKLEEERNATMAGKGAYLYLQQLASIPRAQGKGVG